MNPKEQSLARHGVTTGPVLVYLEATADQQVFQAQLTDDVFDPASLSPRQRALALALARYAVERLEAIA